jgi:hypothetical protein
MASKLRSGLVAAPSNSPTCRTGILRFDIKVPYRILSV